QRLIQPPVPDTKRRADSPPLLPLSRNLSRLSAPRQPPFRGINWHTPRARSTLAPLTITTRKPNEEPNAVHPVAAGRRDRGGRLRQHLEDIDRPGDPVRLDAPAHLGR